jgi:hypothetical protein
VQKLRHARERERVETGRCAGRKGYRDTSPELIGEAERLARKSPKAGKSRTLREIADELVALGYLSPRGRPYLPGSIKNMLAK